MMNKVFLILFTFLALSQTAQATDCDKNYKSGALAGFFSNISEWTEVEAQNSKKPATNKPVEFDVDLKNYQLSEVWVNGKKKGNFLGICSYSKNNAGQEEVVLRAQYGRSKVTLTITKLGKRLLKSHFKILGFTEIYYYRPDTDVDF